MKDEPARHKSAPGKQSRWPLLWPGLFLAGCGVLVLIAIFHSPRYEDSPSTAAPTLTNAAGPRETGRSRATAHIRSLARRSGPVQAQAPSVEEVVASKVSQFGKSRRELVRAIAHRSNKEVPAEVERFFYAIQSGHWEEIKEQWDAMAKRSGQYEGSGHSPELDPFWPAVLDAYGVAEQAHLWPGQKLLDYGQAILDSLKPGMVYVGGTDNGRWIPELLNDTAEGEHHVIVTQNALADGRYLEFVSDLYGDRLTTLTQEDSQRAFQQYIEDAQKRLEHDQQFPDEPKQVRPGEDIRVTDGKVQVSGQVAVMAINERLLGMLMDKNPDRSFAIQESFPFKDTYADALPLGPLMELRAQDGQSSFTAERAAQSLDYLRSRTQQVSGDSETASSDTALRAYSHDTVAAANLLAAHGFTTEAEEAYRLATQLCPYSPESVGALAGLLAQRGRENEAQQLIEEFNRQHPNQQKDLEKSRAAWTVVVSGKSGTP